MKADVQSFGVEKRQLTARDGERDLELGRSVVRVEMAAASNDPVGEDYEMIRDKEIEAVAAAAVGFAEDPRHLALGVFGNS